MDIKLRLARLKFTIEENPRRKLPFQILDNEQNKVIGKFLTKEQAEEFRDQVMSAFCEGLSDDRRDEDELPVLEDERDLSVLPRKPGEGTGQVSLSAV